MKSLYKRRKKNYLPSYIATPEEQEWKLFCTRNNIRISPWATPLDGQWKICINLGNYLTSYLDKAYTKVHLDNLFFYQFCADIFNFISNFSNPVIQRKMVS